MRYCGIVAGAQDHYLCALEEVLPEEPPVQLEAAFYEPGPTSTVAAAVAALGEVVVAVATPLSSPERGRERRFCDEALRGLGIPPLPPLPEGSRLAEALVGLGLFAPAADDTQGVVEEGAFRTARLFETNPEGVFAALQERRLPARRHPLGIQRRVEELLDDQVADPGGDLWHRRIEEIDAAAAAVCAHRYAVGHARWIGDPAEGIVVLPGSHRLERFTTDGVLPEVVRLPLA